MGETKIQVTTEIKPLKKVLIHSPGGEMTNMLPTLRNDWLFDDIVMTLRMQQEYNHFTRILLLMTKDDTLLFTSEDKFNFEAIKDNPESPTYFGSQTENVVDAQFCLAKLFESKPGKARELIIAVCAFHRLHIRRRDDLLAMLQSAEKNKDFDKKNEEGEIKQVNMFMELVKVLITGKLEWEKVSEDTVSQREEEMIKYIFEPIPNFIFTRDIGIIINEHLLITKPRYDVRYREVILLRFIAEHYLFEGDSSKIIEVSEDDDFFQFEKSEKENYRVNFEGGDIMMISPKHLLIGKSERTSNYAINKLVHRIFKENIGIELISVIKIAENRSQMHIDTILTQVKENVWMLHWSLHEEKDEKENRIYDLPFSHLDSLTQKTEDEKRKELSVNILQFFCKKNEDNTNNYKKQPRCDQDFYIYTEEELKNISDKNKDVKLTYRKLQESAEGKNGRYNYTKPEGLEDLLKQISVNEFCSVVKSKKEVKIIYSGAGKYPHYEREQWTDACNLLCVGNGVVIGYDRNIETAKAFENTMKELYESQKMDLPPPIIIFRTDKTGKKKPEENDYHFVVRTEDLFTFFRETLQGDKGKIISFRDNLKDTLLLIPSAELSRARGGSHCMSMPLLRV